MEKKPSVSDEAKRAAAQKAAAAKKAADSKKDSPAPKKAPVKKAVDESAAVEEKVAEEKKQKMEKPITTEEKKSVKGLRIGAIVLWVLALACEVGAFFAFSWGNRNHALTVSPMTTEMLILLGTLVLDIVFCIIAAQLWKKSNRISPNLSNSKLVRTLWHQLGVIMVLICFLPIGIYLAVKSDKLDKKTRTVLIAVCAALFVAASASSVDYQQPSEERVQELQQEAIEANGGADVYWTKFGKSYHFDPDCPHIRGKALVEDGGTLMKGSLEEAFDFNRWDPCDTCSGGADVVEDTVEDTVDTVDEAA